MGIVIVNYAEQKADMQEDEESKPGRKRKQCQRESRWEKETDLTLLRLLWEHIIWTATGVVYP